MKKVQLAKVYKHRRFIGFGIAVGGLLLDGMTTAIIKPTGTNSFTLTAELVVTKELMMNLIDIDLDEPILSNGEGEVKSLHDKA